MLAHAECALSTLSCPVLAVRARPSLPSTDPPLRHSASPAMYPLSRSLSSVSLPLCNQSFSPCRTQRGRQRVWRTARERERRVSRRWLGRASWSSSSRPCSLAPRTWTSDGDGQLLAPDAAIHRSVHPPLAVARSLRRRTPSPRAPLSLPRSPPSRSLLAPGAWQASSSAPRALLTTSVVPPAPPPARRRLSPPPPPVLLLVLVLPTRRTSTARRRPTRSIRLAQTLTRDATAT